MKNLGCAKVLFLGLRVEGFFGLVFRVEGLRT